MADINTTLGLDLDEAFRDLDRLSAAIDRALGTVEIRLDAFQAQRQLDQLAQDADRALSDVDVNIDSTGAARLNDELAGVERNLTQADSEAEQLAGSLREADRAADNINTTSTGLASRFGSLQTAALGIASAFAAIGVGQLFGVAIRSANAAIQSFAQLEDSINAVNVVFREGAGVALAFGETASQSAGLSQEAFNNAIAPIGALLTNFGFNAREAADAAVILVQRGADLASVYGGSVQDALLAINSALVGQVEPLRRFGGEISQARVEAFALATGLLQAGQEMDTATAVQARFGLILKDTAVVAGDFVNTSDDLANAQRIAAAEAQNFGADIGEVLAPAMEVLVGLVPELLEGLRQLVPGFANAADSAAGFFESINEGGGFRAPLQAIGAGLGLVGDSLGGIGDVASGVFTVLQLDFEAAGDQAEQFGERFARAAQRVIGQNLARQLDSGTDAVTAFGNSISAFGRQEENLAVFADTFRTFAIQANLSGQELQFVTGFLLQNADAAGFSADEIQFLNEQLALLNDTLAGTDVGAARTANRIRDDLNAALQSDPSTFTTFTTVLEGEIARLPSFIVDARVAAAQIGEALDPFDDAAEAIDISAEEFFNNLVAQIEQQAQAQANIARLIAAGFDDVAAEIAKAGPGANRAAEQFLNNLDLAEAAERLLDGEGTAISRQIGDELTAELSSSTMTSEIETAFISAINGGIFTNSQVEAAILSGSAQSASQTISAFRDQLEAEGANFDASFLSASIGAAIGASLDFSDEAAAAASKTVNAYEQTFRDDFEISSPSKLMMRLGEEAVAGFLQGSDMSGLQLRTPEVGVTGTAVSAVSEVAGGGGIHVELTTINPTVQDEVSDVARMGQIASSIAASYRSVVPNGM